MSQAEAKSHVLEHDGAPPDKKRKRTKRGMGKACVYCRRSIKRDISHLCRDFSPPRRQSTPNDHSHPHAHAGPSRTSHNDNEISSAFPLDDPDGDASGNGNGNDHAGNSSNASGNGTVNGKGNGMNRTYSGQLTSVDPSQLNSNLPLYSDPNFAPAWPLLPDASGGMGMGGGGDGWVGDDQTELGALSKYLGDLGVPNLPGGFLDVLTYFTKGGSGSGSNSGPNNSASSNGLGLGDIRNLPIAGVTGLGTGPGGSGTNSGVQTPRISGLEGTNFADITGSAGLRLGEEGEVGNALGGAVFPPMSEVKSESEANGSAQGEGQGQAQAQVQGSRMGPGQGQESGQGGQGGAALGAGAGLHVQTAPGTVNATANPTAAASTAMTRDNSGRASGTATATTTAKGKGKEVVPLGNLSRIERYFLAAADQPSGPRSSRLSQVIKAKYDAGLLRPYDYVKGYERMKEWMDSGRAAPRVESAAPSAPGSPTKLGATLAASTAAHGSHTKSGGLKPLTSTNAGTPSGLGGEPTGTTGKNDNANISPDGRRRIWAAMNGFRPKFRQIARTLTEVDLVFIEEAMERWMLQYDRAFASIHTPSCIWRRTGEIQKANQEFANLTGIPASMFRNGQLCVYELMDEASAVRYWEGYAKIAFDAGQRSLYISCTLRIPTSLTRLPPRLPYATPTLLAAPKTAAAGPGAVLGVNVPGGASGAVAGATGYAGASASASRNMSIPDLQLPQSLVQTANGTAPVRHGVGDGGGTGTPGTSRGDAVEGVKGVEKGAGAAAANTSATPVPASASATLGMSTAANGTSRSQASASPAPTSNVTRERERDREASPTSLVPAPNTSASASAAARSRIQASTATTGTATGPKKETYREIKCCFSVTIRRDAWGVPVAIMGQWIPI